jgi:antibiotic biosynthesis monooxygenase (ABM) superfamily enzyme
MTGLFLDQATGLTGTVVFLMVYVIMPRYTKLVRKWLYD